MGNRHCQEKEWLRRDQGSTVTSRKKEARYSSHFDRTGSLINLRSSLLGDGKVKLDLIKEVELALGCNTCKVFCQDEN